MMIFLHAVLTFWGIGTAVIALCGAVTYVDAKGPLPRKKGARMMFGSPLWPVIGAIVIARNFRQVWRDAHWDELKR